MTISPQELRDFSRGAVNVEDICKDIDSRLRQFALTEDLATAVTVSVKRIPSWAVREIEKRYKAAGWTYVQVSRQADAFTYLTFGLPIE